MREPASVTVEIYGQAYTLKGGADPAYVQEVADLVDERMREISKNSSVASTARIAILAAVNIADELIRERNSGNEALVTLENRSEQIARLLENEVGKDPSPTHKRDSLPGT